MRLELGWGCTTPTESSRASFEHAPPHLEFRASSIAWIHLSSMSIRYESQRYVERAQFAESVLLFSRTRRNLRFAFCPRGWTLAFSNSRQHTSCIPQPCRQSNRHLDFLSIELVSRFALWLETYHCHPDRCSRYLPEEAALQEEGSPRQRPRSKRTE